MSCTEIANDRKWWGSQRSAAQTSTAWKHQASHCQQTDAGSSQSTDWECLNCLQWFASRQNGPDNHLRFCLQQSSSSTNRTGLKPASPPVILKDQSKPDGDNLEDSQASSDCSSKTSDTNSNMPSNQFTRECGACQVRSREFENNNGTVQLYYFLNCESS